MEVAVLHDGVDHQRHVVVLHADPKQGVEVGVVQTPQQRGALQEARDLLVMSVLFLEPWIIQGVGGWGVEVTMEEPFQRLCEDFNEGLSYSHNMES